MCSLYCFVVISDINTIKWTSQSFGGVRTFSHDQFVYREWIRKSFPVDRIDSVKINSSLLMMKECPLLAAGMNWLRLIWKKESEHLSLLSLQVLSCSVFGLRWWQVSSW